MRLCEENITLTGKAAALELLSIAHHEDLVEAVQDGDLHKLWYTNHSLCLRDARRDQPALRVAPAGLNVPFCAQKPEDSALCWYDNLYEY